ncbi:MAG: hypothetical protein WBP26_01535 [Candidatus Saccharimonadales bacterium]
MTLHAELPPSVEMPTFDRFLTDEHLQTLGVATQLLAMAIIGKEVDTSWYAESTTSCLGDFYHAFGKGDFAGVLETFTHSDASKKAKNTARELGLLATLDEYTHTLPRATSYAFTIVSRLEDIRCNRIKNTMVELAEWFAETHRERQHMYMPGEISSIRLPPWYNLHREVEDLRRIAHDADFYLGLYLR